MSPTSPFKAIVIYCELKEIENANYKPLRLPQGLRMVA